MAKYKVWYDDIKITESTQNVLTDGCCSCSFVNIGTDDAIINNNIQLNSGDTFEFNNLANEFIGDPFTIRFGGSVAPSIVMIRKFAKMVN